MGTGDKAEDEKFSVLFCQLASVFDRWSVLYNKGIFKMLETALINYNILVGLDDDVYFIRICFIYA